MRARPVARKPRQPRPPRPPRANPRARPKKPTEPTPEADKIVLTLDRKDHTAKGPINPEYQDPGTGRFKTGNPGRPKGAKKKLPRELVRKILAVTEYLEAKGKSLTAEAEKDPKWFYETFLKPMLPKRVNVEETGDSANKLNPVLAAMLEKITGIKVDPAPAPKDEKPEEESRKFDA